eukprot:TRINITY_DN2236_c0_g1_i1.p1 TRINITY_DN2236_c0_g1~~TRINITY_DN2236_c0_g1_i1.p1  ORF type:complete len:1097 (+),score=204.62 TRINITY_DN2236_c0_g1_i1:282-3572(+)
MITQLSILCVFVLFGVLCAGEYPTVVLDFDVTVSELYPGGNVPLNGLVDDSDSYLDTLKVKRTNTNGCRYFVTDRRIYRGNCGTNEYDFSVPSYPFATSANWQISSSYAAADFNMDTITSQEVTFNLGGFRTRRFTRVYSSTLGETLVRCRNWFFAWIDIWDGKQAGDYILDYDYGQDRTYWFLNLKASLGNLGLREVSHFGGDTIPMIMERKFVYYTESYPFSASISKDNFVFHVSGSVLGYIDLNGVGILSRGRIYKYDDWKLSSKHVFLLDSGNNGIYLVYEKEDGSSAIVQRSITERGPGTSLNLRLLSGQLFTHAYTIPSTGDHLLTTDKGALFVLNNNKQLQKLDLQLGVGVSSAFVSLEQGGNYKGYLSLEADVGLIIEVYKTSSSSFIQNIAVLENGKPHTILKDPHRDSIIVLTDDSEHSYLYVLTTNPLSSTEYVKVYENILFSDDASFDPNTLTVVVSERECQGSCKVFRLDVADCSSYSCRECGTVNPVYCGACDLNTSKCFNSLTCPTGNTFGPGISCPYLVTATPLSGPITGNTEISVLTSGYNGVIPTGAQCTMNGNPISTQFNPPIITCTTSAGSGVQNLSVTTYAEEFPFQFYECGDFDCSTCLEYSDCSWSANEALCITGSTGIDYCPEILSVVPDIMLFINVPRPIDIKSSGLDNSSDYRCIFNELGVTTPANLTSYNKVSCSSPSASELSSHLGEGIRVSIQVQSDGTWKNHTQIESIHSVTVTQCSNIKTCDTCISVGCNFCDDYTCSDTACVSPLATCPYMNPLSLIADEKTGGTTMEVNMNFIPDVFMGAKRDLTAPLFCVFESESVKYENVTVDIINSTAYCVTPSGIPGNYLFYLADSTGVPLTEGLDFEIYDCADQITCDQCHDSAFPRCEFCDGSCKLSETCTSIGCPSITSMNPNAVPVSGGDVVLTTSHLQDTTDVKCSIGTTIIEPKAKTTSSITCTFPGKISGTYDIKLVKKGEVLASGNTLEYYSCSHASGCVGCVDSRYPMCSFCAGKCSYACGLNAEECPFIDSVSPLVMEIDKQNTIEIVMILHIVPVHASINIVDSALELAVHHLHFVDLRYTMEISVLT